MKSPKICTLISGLRQFLSLIKGKNLYTRDRKKSVLFKLYPYKQLYPYKGVPYKWLLLYFTSYGVMTCDGVMSYMNILSYTTRYWILSKDFSLLLSLHVRGEVIFWLDGDPLRMMLLPSDPSNQPSTSHIMTSSSPSSWSNEVRGWHFRHFQCVISCAVSRST